MKTLIKKLNKNLVLTEVEYIDNQNIMELHIEYDKNYHSCCPDCGQPALRKNGTHQRCVKDLPVMDHMVILVIKVRELFCDNPECSRKTFSEDFDFIGITGKRTRRLDDLLIRSFAESSAIATERRVRGKIADVSNDSILRLVKKNASKSNK